MSVYNMKLIFFLQKLRLRRLVIGWKQQDFHSMPNSMKVTHHFTNDLVFLVFLFIFTILYLSILMSPIVWPAAAYFQASAVVHRDGSWERPICGCWDLCYFFYIFSPFSFNPVHSGETVDRGETGGKPCASPTFTSFPSLISVFLHSQGF